MSKRRMSWLAVVVLTAVLIAAAAYWSPHAPPHAVPPRVDKVSIALSMTPHSSIVHIAVEKGFFARHGLDVIVVPTTHGKEAIALLAADVVDFATAAEPPIVIATMNGVPLAIVASIFNVASENAIVALRDRGIARTHDLAGKRIGVAFGTSGDYFLWAFLTRNRLSPRAVTLVDTDAAHIADAIGRGDVDAVATWPPVLYGIQSALGERAVSIYGADAYTEGHFVVGNAAFVHAHPEVVVNMVRALFEAERFMRSDPEAALAIVSRRVGAEEEGLGPIWKKFDFSVGMSQSSLSTLEDVARWAMARQYVTARPMPNFLSDLYLDALLAVRPERVTVIR